MDEAKRLQQNAEWWIKADGVDVVSGLSESVTLQWSGDVDLNNGMVEKMHNPYLKRVKYIIEHTRLSKDPEDLNHGFQRLRKDLFDELKFVNQRRVCISTH